jgi:small GTP-binding protein
MLGPIVGMLYMTIAPPKKTVKLAVVGDGGAGKSTLISRLVTGEFIDKNMTIGFDVESWSIPADGSSMKVALFDFGGQKQFRFFQGSLILGAKAALIVFDCGSFNSLLKIREWMGLVSAIPNDRKLLVGTKLDAGILVPCNDVEDLATEFGIDYMMVSSKTGENFDLLIDRLKDMVTDA